MCSIGFVIINVEILAARIIVGGGIGSGLFFYSNVVRGLGIEPRLTESKSAILPLDEPP